MEDLEFINLKKAGFDLIDSGKLVKHWEQVSSMAVRSVIIV